MSLWSFAWATQPELNPPECFVINQRVEIASNVDLLIGNADAAGVERVSEQRS